MHAISKKSWLWYFSLILLIVTSNTLLYQLSFLHPLPEGIALASLFDLVIVIPLITYFIIIRKRYSLKYIIPVALAGYGVALLIVPNGLLSSYSFVKYILFAGEGAFLLVELYVIYKLVTKIPTIIKTLKLNKADIPTFQYRLEQALNQQLKPSRLLSVLATDLSIFYFSLCTWKKKQINHFNQEQMFTYHKKTSALALNIMLIHALILESVGFHFLLHSWNEVVAIVSLVLNAYTLLYLLAETHAIRLSPFILTERHLSLQVGVGKQLIASIEDIKSIHYYEGPEKLSKEESKEVLDAVLADFMKEKPVFEIEFKRPQVAKFMYGMKKKVTIVHLSPDEPERFYQAIQEKIER